MASGSSRSASSCITHHERAKKRNSPHCPPAPSRRQPRRRQPTRSCHDQSSAQAPSHRGRCSTHHARSSQGRCSCRSFGRPRHATATRRSRGTGHATHAPQTHGYRASCCCAQTTGSGRRSACTEANGCRARRRTATTDCWCATRAHHATKASHATRTHGRSCSEARRTIRHPDGRTCSSTRICHPEATGSLGTQATWATGSRRSSHAAQTLRTLALRRRGATHPGPSRRRAEACHGRTCRNQTRLSRRVKKRHF